MNAGSRMRPESERPSPSEPRTSQTYWSAPASITITDRAPTGRNARQRAFRRLYTIVDDSMVPDAQETVCGLGRLKEQASKLVSKATFGCFGNNANLKIDNSHFDIRAEQGIQNPQDCRLPTQGDMRKSHSYAISKSEYAERRENLRFPELVELEVLSCKIVRVALAPNILSDRHTLILKSDSVEENFETTECEFVIDDEIFVFEKGVKYTIIAKICWAEHNSLATKREFITGLKNPTDLTCELDHSNFQRPVKFTWKNSRGMFAAKIQLKELNNSLIVEETTRKSCWEYWGLKPNTTYEMFLWPGDGRKFFYDDCLRHKFTTAPTPPTSVICKTSESDPQSAFDVTIVSDYNGPFLTQVMKMNNEIVTTHIGCKKVFSITKLNRGTRYRICSQCVFGEFISGRTFIR